MARPPLPAPYKNRRQKDQESDFTATVSVSVSVPSEWLPCVEGQPMEALCSPKVTYTGCGIAPIWRVPIGIAVCAYEDIRLRVVLGQLFDP
jgi:hypothetical protein